MFPIGYVPGGLNPIAKQMHSARLTSFGYQEGGTVMIPPLIAQISHQEQMEKEAATKSKRAVSTLAKSPLELSPVTFLAKPNSGIARPFWDKPELLEEFIRLHELFIRIASLIELLNKAYALSGEGGNILIYGFARKQMASLVVDYTLLSNAVRDSVFIIEQHADGLYQHLVPSF
jgi:hypothetical protein